MVCSDEEISRLHRIRKTVLEMLKDRGYLVGDFEMKITRAEFLEKFGENLKREDLTIAKGLNGNEDEKIYVFFPEEEKVGIKTIKTYTSRMKEDGVHRAIVVVRKNLSPFARTCINEISSKFYLEVFQEAELLINVTKHKLVPRHEVLTSEGKKTLLQRYTVKETQLPRMQVTDPVARYYGMRRGQVVKIIRESETAGQYVTYRYVI